MRVKKFDNLWTMGLIIFAVLLCAFYIAKVISPDFVVGVAQTSSVVKFGEFVDTHVWAYYLFYFPISFISSYILICASCRTRTLHRKMAFLIALFLALSYYIEAYISEFSLVYNLCFPLFFCLIYTFFQKDYGRNLLVSTCVTFITNSFAQVLTLEIRDISTMVQYPNTATFTVLIIDGYIWQFLLYFFFNSNSKKEEVQNG